MKFSGIALLGALAAGVSAELEKRNVYSVAQAVVDSGPSDSSPSSLADDQPLESAPSFMQETSPPTTTGVPYPPPLNDTWTVSTGPGTVFTRPIGTGTRPGTGYPYPTGPVRPRTTHKVIVGAQGKLVFQPNSVRASIGDLVQFDFLGRNHSVAQSNFDTPCKFNGGFDSGFQFNARNESNRFIRSYVVKSQKPTWFYCKQTGHCAQGMVFGINPGMKMYQFIRNAKSGGNSTYPTGATGTVVITRTSTIRSTVPGSVSTRTMNVTSTVSGSVTTQRTTSVTTLPGSVVTKTSTIRTTVTIYPTGTGISVRPSTSTLVVTKTITSLTTVSGAVSTKVVTSYSTTLVTISPTINPTVTTRPVVTKPPTSTTVVTVVTTVVTTIRGSPTTKLTTKLITTRPTTKPTPNTNAGTLRRVQVTLEQGEKLCVSPRYLMYQNNGDTIRFDVRAANHTLYESSFDQPCRKLAGSKIDLDFQKIKPNQDGGRVFDLKLGSDCGKPRWFYLKPNGDRDSCGKDMVFAVNPRNPKQYREFVAKAENMVPKAGDKVPKAENKVPKAEDKVPKTENKVPKA